MPGLWSFGEIKFVHACSRGMTAGEIADELNTRYHEGQCVRSGVDVDRLRARKNNIFSFEARKKGSGDETVF